jgi:hypothetical protein
MSGTTPPLPVRQHGVQRDNFTFTLKESEITSIMSTYIAKRGSNEYGITLITKEHARTI